MAFLWPFELSQQLHRKALRWERILDGTQHPPVGHCFWRGIRSDILLFVLSDMLLQMEYNKNILPRIRPIVCHHRPSLRGPLILERPRHPEQFRPWSRQRQRSRNSRRFDCRLRFPNQPRAPVLPPVPRQPRAARSQPLRPLQHRGGRLGTVHPQRILRPHQAYPRRRRRALRFGGRRWGLGYARAGV